jgi:hypothetical protein
MTSTRISTGRWLEAAFEAMKETATGALGYEDIELVGKREEPPDNASGAYIAMLSPTASLQLGIVASEKVCQTFAKALFALDPADDDLPSADVADALGEIANITAGVVKRIMVEQEGSFQLGLPIFIHGSITPSDEQDVAVADVKVGEHTAHVVVITPESTE